MALDMKQVTEQVTERLGKAAKQLSSGAGNAVKELTGGAGNAARELTNTADKSIKRSTPWPRRRRGTAPWTVIVGVVVGAVAVYFLDPERGRTRRAQFIDWTGARFRRGWSSVNQLTREAQSNAGGLSQRMISLRSASGRGPVDDLTLRDRVESEVFRNRSLPKGQINFEVESAIVTVRGQVENAFQIATIEKAVLKVPGVNGVENLLHVQGTPAPNKQEARESTR